VLGKIFTICDINKFESINLKYDPVKVIELREMYPGVVIPGYRMNKKHYPKVGERETIPLISPPAGENFFLSYL